METKLIAAEIATAAGVTTVITSSKNPKNIFKIIEYNNALRSGTSTPLHTSSGQASPSLGTTGASAEDVATLLQLRPPHTLFKPSPTPLRDLKSWTTHTLCPAGSVIIDAGAHQVLSKRESGGRLLAAGVLGVRGAFASGQAVRICIRRRQPTMDDKEQQAEAAKARDLYLNAMTTEPSTPTLAATSSSPSPVSAIDGMMESSSLHDENSTPSTTLKTLPEDDHVLLGPENNESDEWEVEEVGRGLANYNSAQIARVKGLKRLVSLSFTFRQLTHTLSLLVHIYRKYWAMLILNTSWKTSLYAFHHKLLRLILEHRPVTHCVKIHRSRCSFAAGYSSSTNSTEFGCCSESSSLLLPP